MKIGRSGEPMTGIDIPSFLETYGLPGLMILGLMWVVKALWARLNEQIDARFSDHKAHSEQMAANTKTLDEAMKFVGGQSRG